MRTLPQTIDTIREVIQQFRELYEVTIFVHTWKGQDFKLLEPDYYRTTDQEEQFKNLNIPEYLTAEALMKKMTEQQKKWYEEWLKKKGKIPPYITTNYATYSRKQVTLLALSKIPIPELVVFIRPDIFFKTIDVSSLVKQFNHKSKRIQIITPDFDNKTEQPNDRFAICLGPSAARVYSSQYDHLDEMLSEGRLFNGEAVLHWVFKRYNVINIESPMCFYLMRSDGRKIGFCKTDNKKVWS
jgi:hypothetical protein